MKFDEDRPGIYNLLVIYEGEGQSGARIVRGATGAGCRPPQVAEDHRKEDSWS